MIHVNSNRWQCALIVAIAAVTWFSPFSVLAADEPGKVVFSENCSSCHTIGSGRLVGPDLANVHDRRSADWLLKFVKSSQTLVKNGDPQAIAIFNEYNQIPMPEPNINEQQLSDVLSYIKKASAEVEQPITVTAANKTANNKSNDNPIAAITKEDILHGQQLFQGITRFANGGPTCNSCHDVKNDAVIGGGILATELTTVFSKMGGKGVRAILGKPPFPVMEAAYKEKALTKAEIIALVAFFQFTDKEHIYQQPRDYGVGLLISGMIGSVVLLGIYSLLWLRRKKDSVNQGIYDRQVKSVSDE